MGEKSEVKKNYRNWTAEEDAKLVEALLDMVNGGKYKADNGFKAGYLTYLEDVLKVALPNSAILGKPHIDSRIRTLKQGWQIVHDMLNGSNSSGFGYDYEKNCVTADADVWEAYLKVHKKAGKWRNRAFPHYEQLCDIFGKDRAKGNRAKDFLEMEEDANREEVDEFNDVYDVSDETTTPIPSTNGGELRAKRKRAKHQGALLEGITKAASLFNQELASSTTKLSAAMESDMDIQRKTSMVMPELNKMTSLSTREMYKAFKKITSVPENVLGFFSLNEDQREDWVKYLLEEDA